jgi:hypothetical protein
MDANQRFIKRRTNRCDSESWMLQKSNPPSGYTSVLLSNRLRNHSTDLTVRENLGTSGEMGGQRLSNTRRETRNSLPAGNQESHVIMAIRRQPAFFSADEQPILRLT